MIRKNSIRTAVLALSVLALAACGGEKKNTKIEANLPDPAASSGGGGGGGGGEAYDAAKGTGSVKVTVKHSGKPGTNKMYSMPNADCASHDGKFVLERTEQNADGGVPHCFVWVVDGPVKDLTGYDKSKKVVVDQKDCVYTTHVFGTMVGQGVEFKNSDGFLHNVHGKPAKNDPFNYSQPAGKSDTWVPKKTEEAVEVVCDVHSWMSSWVFVLKHPFHAVTARGSGSAVISGLYPGKYKLKVWHESWAAADKVKTVEVEVGAGEASVEVDLAK